MPVVILFSLVTVLFSGVGAGGTISGGIIFSTGGTVSGGIVFSTGGTVSGGIVFSTGGTIFSGGIVFSTGGIIFFSGVFLKQTYCIQPTKRPPTVHLAIAS